MTQIDLLESVLAKTGDIVGGVSDDQLGLPTPCSDYDVKALRNHIVGWVQVFAAGSTEEPYDGDAGAYEAGDDPAAEFRDAADRVVEGWRSNGFDRTVKLMGGDSPAPMVFNMTLMEYVTHGWDLATATGQPVPFTDDEAETVLGLAEQTLPDDYRGTAFAPRVEVPADAPPIDRLVGFMGRRP